MGSTLRRPHITLPRPRTAADRAHARRRTLDLRAVVGVVLLGVAAAMATAGVGAPGHRGPLGWSGDVAVFAHPTLPGDRVLTATLRNDGRRPVRVDIGDVRLVDAGGATVASAPVFLESFGKTLWGAGRGPVVVPDSELQRTGRIALLSPGEEVPLTIAWHAADGSPVKVDYGKGSLRLPG